MYSYLFLENKKKFSLHVRFCNDNGRRSWTKMLSKYSGKDNLLSKYPNCLVSSILILILFFEKGRISSKLFKCTKCY